MENRGLRKKLGMSGKNVQEFIKKKKKTTTLGQQQKVYHKHRRTPAGRERGKEAILEMTVTESFPKLLTMELQIQAQRTVRRTNSKIKLHQGT